MVRPGEEPLPGTPRPGNITRRIGPSVPSPLLTSPILLLLPLSLSTRENDFRTTMFAVTSGWLRGRCLCSPSHALYAAEERMWRADEDPAQGIPDAGLALRGAGLRRSLGVHRDLLYTRRRHRCRRVLGSCGDALGGLGTWACSTWDTRCGCSWPC